LDNSINSNIRNAPAYSLGLKRDATKNEIPGPGQYDVSSGIN